MVRAANVQTKEGACSRWFIAANGPKGRRLRVLMRFVFDETKQSRRVKRSSLEHETAVPSQKLHRDWSRFRTNAV